MGTAAISDGDYVHACMNHADLILLVGHDIVEKPPFLMHPTDKRTVIHLNYSGASVNSSSWWLAPRLPRLRMEADVAPCGTGSVWQDAHHSPRARYHTTSMLPVRLPQRRCSLQQIICISL